MVVGVMGWMRIKLLKFNSNIIYIPKDLIEGEGKKIKLAFGRKTKKVMMLPTNETSLEENTGFIAMSQSVVHEMNIPIDLQYQVKVKQDRIELGPVIGLLLGRQCLYYNDKNMSESTESLCEYDRIGGLFYAFIPEGIDYKRKKIYGLYYSQSGKWEYGIFPYPSVIFRRGFQSNEKEVRKMKRLVCDVIFNSVKWDKYKMHQLLEKDKQISEYLPDTVVIVNSQVVQSHLMKYRTIILKPTNLSRGRGIFIMNKKENNRIEVIDCVKKDDNVSYITMEKLDEFLFMNGFYTHHYIMQNRIDLACVNTCPFDIRVVMHKNCNNTWNCSGIECRIAGAEKMISNIANGGSALSISRTLRLTFGTNIDIKAMKEKVIQLAHNICINMDKHGEYFAEIGLDIGIDKAKGIWFIEANVRPSFKGFKYLSYSHYLYICSRPIAYAVALTGFEMR